MAWARSLRPEMTKPTTTIALAAAGLPPGAEIRALHALALPAEPPEAIQLLPAGTFAGVDGRGPYRVADAAAVVADSLAAAPGGRLAIDYDHAIDLAAPEGRPAPAAGWVTGLEIRDGAIWGRVEWTEDGARAVRARHYSFISPVFTHGKADGVVARVLRASLTNAPNLQLAALHHSQTEEADMDKDLVTVRQALGLKDDADAPAIVAHTKTLAAANAALTTALATVRKALGAAEDADGAVLAAQVARLKADGEAKGTSNEALRTELASLRGTVDGLGDAERGRALDALQAQGKLTPAEREHFAKIQKSDPETFQALMTARVAVVTPGAGKAASGQVERGARAMDDDAKKVCQLMGVDPKKFEETLKEDGQAQAA